MKLDKMGRQSYKENIKRIDRLLADEVVDQAWADRAKEVWKNLKKEGNAGE